MRLYLPDFVTTWREASHETHREARPMVIAARRDTLTLSHHDSIAASVLGVVR
jgi:hypothetical protein